MKQACKATKGLGQSARMLPARQPGSGHGLFGRHLCSAQLAVKWEQQVLEARAAPDKRTQLPAARVHVIVGCTRK